MDETLELLRGAAQHNWVLALVVLLSSLVAAKLVDLIICRVISRLIRASDTDLDDRLMALLHRPIFITIVLFGIYFATAILDPGATPLRIVIGVVHTVLVLLWAGAVMRIISELLTWMTGLADRVSWIDARTVPLFDNLLKLLVIGGAVYCLLLAWRLDVTPWLASAGIAGIAIGFAAKDTLANVFGGLFVIVDAPYKIGDFVTLDTGERGRVVKIGLRSTRIITRDDVEVTVPNAQIANTTIVNESGGPSEKTRVPITVGVAYGSDVDQVRDVLLRAARSVELAVDDPAPRVRFMEMGDSALIFRVLCWIDEPVLRGRTIDALNSAVYKALGQAKIEIPFPQRDVHIKNGSPPGNS